MTETDGTENLGPQAMPRYPSSPSGDALPDTTFYRKMARGHLARTGHELRGFLHYNDDGWTVRLVRTCCENR